MTKKIQKLRDVIHKKINQWSETGINKYISSVRPIYISTENENPKHIATGTLLHVAKKKYLVTAAHVIDYNAKSCLYLAGEKELVMLEGNANVTKKPNDERKRDHFDFCWMELSDDILMKLGDVKYIDMQREIPGYEDEHTSLYLALGYPNSKNKKIDNYNKSITPKYFSYTSTNKEISELYNKLNVSNHSHIFLGHDSKYSSNYGGKKINSLKPTGISGGPLIYIGNVSKIENYIEDTEMNYSLAGILVEFHKQHRAISSVKIKVVIDEILRA